MLDEAGDELAEVFAFGDDAVDEGEGGGQVMAAEDIGELGEQGEVNSAEDLGDHVGRDGALGVGHGLVEQGEGVAHGPVGGVGQHRDGLAVDLDGLFLGHAADGVLDVADADAVEVEALAAGEDGGEDAMGLGGGEDEDDVGGRLLERLEEGVEGGGAEHVHLVDDVHLDAQLSRGEGHPFEHGANIIHAAVGGGVELEDVEGAAGDDAFTGRALPTGRGCGTMLAVKCHGKHERGAGLPGAAGPTEQVGVSGPAGLDRVGQGLGDVSLADDLGEVPRAIFAVEGKVGHAPVPDHSGFGIGGLGPAVAGRFRGRG